MLEAKEALERVFGFSDFRPGQEDVLKSRVRGREYSRGHADRSWQIASLSIARDRAQRRLTVVVSPLIALMRDQVQQLQRVASPPPP